MDIFSNKQNCQIFHRILLDVLERNNFLHDNTETAIQISQILKENFQINFDPNKQTINFISPKQELFYIVKYG